MSDSPKHPADPANELASDNSAIDPRDFRNALGTFATGVTIVTAMAADGKPYGVTCNSFASVSLNPPLVLWSLGMFSQGLTIFQNASHFTVNILGASQQALASQVCEIFRRQICRSELDARDLAMPQSWPTASPISNAEPPTDITAAITLSSWGPLKPTPIITGSRCCLRAAASASLLLTMAINLPDRTWIHRWTSGALRQSQAWTGVLFPSHLGTIPIANLAGRHQRHAVVADDIVEQCLQILDAMGYARNVRMN